MQDVLDWIHGILFNLKEWDSDTYTAWRYAEDMKLSGINQTQKEAVMWFHLYEGPGVIRCIETEKRMEIFRGWEEGGMSTGKWGRLHNNMDALIAWNAHWQMYIVCYIYTHTHTHIYIYFSMLYYNKSLKKKYWIEFCKQWEALKVLVNGRIRPSGTFVFVYFFLNVIFRIKLLIFFF